jgi:hypothetical protein
MKRSLLVIILIIISFTSKALDRSDTLVYQFGNDTILQTLSVNWTSDTSFSYNYRIQDLRGGSESNFKGASHLSPKVESPYIKQYLSSEFPSDVYLGESGPCQLTFYVQYLHKERVWVESECKSLKILPHLSATSVGMLERVDPTY